MNKTFELNVLKMRRYCFFPDEPVSANGPLVNVVEATPIDGPFMEGSPPHFNLEAWENAHFWFLFTDRKSFRAAWRDARVHLRKMGFEQVRTGDMIGELGQSAI